MITRLQEQETLIAKLQEELEKPKDRAEKSKKVARQQTAAAPPTQQAELLSRIQESESVIQKLQSELDGAKGTTRTFMAKEAPAVRELETDSPEPLANAASAIAPAASDISVNYGSPITTVDTIDANRSEELKRLLEEGKDFQKNGRFDLAQKRFEQSLYLDNSNPEARDGLAATTAARTKYATSAYNEARSNIATAVEAGWELPVRKFNVGTSSIITQSGTGQDVAAKINQKLDEIIIPRVDFQDVTIREALDFLNQRAVSLDGSEIDPARKGVNIDLKLPEGAVESESRITLALTDIPLRAAITYVAYAANLKLNVQPDTVSVVPLTVGTEALITKEYKVPANFFPASPSAREATTSGSVSVLNSQPETLRYLESIGVTFPPGATAYYMASRNKLIVKNTVAAIDLVDALVENAKPKPEAQAFGNEIATAKEPFSTFSLHVSDVSFQLAKDALARGTMPDPARIRAEEFYNAFDYNDPAPGAGEEVACRIEQSAHPFLQQRNLARIAVKVAAAGRADGQPLRLTILLDTSGSMEREDRAASVRRALQSLVSLLGPNDRVTLIGFARTPRLLAENVPGDQGLKLIEAADRTPSQGGTNLEEALALASELALKNRLPNGQNRIVLLTDGAANLGNANPERLAQQIDKTRQQGISFDACGVGAKGLNDEILEALTRKGDGRYYFLNKPEDADEGFARQLAGAFRPAAENVKVQVVFNPSRVASYRLIGFEKHLLEKQDFRNDKVQAAELSAEEAGVALYQIQPLPEGSGELGEVFVRFRDPATGKMVERSWTMPYEERVPSFDQAAPSLQLAATAALLAERLAGNEQIDLNALAPVLNGLRGRYGEQQRVGELLQMFERVRR
jgi:hypothetical protein